MRTPLRYVLPLAACLCAAAAPVLADAPADKPTPCSAPEHRQFDFWLGDWEVRNPAGKLVGTNRITLLHQGCALLENWTGNGGVTGTSLSIYDAGRGKWHQTWVDSTGGLLELDGTFADGRMALTSSPDRAFRGTEAISRVTWQRLPDGRVRQLWETSADSGATWKVVFEGLYQKRS